MLRHSMFVAVAAAAAALLSPTKADAWGAAHVGYTHVGPSGAYHYGRTAAVGPYGSYRGAMPAMADTVADTTKTAAMEAPTTTTEDTITARCRMGDITTVPVSTDATDRKSLMVWITNQKEERGDQTPRASAMKAPTG